MSNLEAVDAYQSESTVIVCFTEDRGYCIRSVKLTMSFQSEERWLLSWDEKSKDASALLILAGPRDDLALVARIWVTNGTAHL